MIFRVLLKILVILTLLAGCSQKDVTPIAPEIIGEWETDIYISQLGNTISYYHFKEDNTFTSRLRLLHGNVELKGEGTFAFEDNNIVLTIKGKTYKEKYILEGDTLIFFDGPDFQIKHKKKQ